MNPRTLSMWTVYERPRDYPEHYVARRWENVGGREPVPTTDVFVAASLAEVRALLPPGLHCIPRFPDDQPVIVEIWL